MENTLENKAKFFAQYWGQNIMIWNEGTVSMPPQKVGISYMTKYGVLNRKLELKPLSLITDDDVRFCTELMGVILTGDTDYYREMLIEGFKNKEFYGTFYPYIVIEIIDFLRSQGYAIPWMGLSVEKLVEYGWIKLKEN